MNGRRWWLAAALSSVNALVSMGFSIAGLVASSSDVFARYAAARSVPLAIVTIVFVLRRASRELAGIALVLGLVQASDALVGIASHDVGKTLGPCVIAILTLASLPWLRSEACR